MSHFKIYIQSNVIYLKISKDFRYTWLADQSKTTYKTACLDFLLTYINVQCQSLAACYICNITIKLLKNKVIF